MGLYHNLLLNPDVYIGTTGILTANIIVYLFIAFVLLFYPLAGLIGDIKCGRFKTIRISLYLILFVAIAAPVIIGGFVLAVSVDNSTLFILLVTIISIATTAMACVLYIGVILFSANVIQFGLDQLHDSPALETSLFIHWYLWIYSVSKIIVLLALSCISYKILRVYYRSTYVYSSEALYKVGISLLVLVSISTIVFLIVSLCVAHHKKHWFLIESRRRFSPYKLVHKISKFAFKHKLPLCRSAFTYCEDNLPSGLDLGKEKYGGPYTVEEVEDVKVFYGILKILFALGPVFFLEVASSSLLPMFAQHRAGRYFVDNVAINYTNITGFFNEQIFKAFLINNGMLTPLLLVILIPLYSCLFRSYLIYIPTILKRMSIGIVFSLLSLLCTFVMDVISNLKKTVEEDVCSLGGINTFYSLHGSVKLYNSTSEPTATLDTSLLVLQLSLSAVSQLLIYISVFEFICAQSPQSMKGMLIGLSFAIKGLFQLLAVCVIIPLSLWKLAFPSCEFVYYLVNTAIGFVVLVVFILVAKRYKYRVRDEPSRERQYAEHYYTT